MGSNQPNTNLKAALSYLVEKVKQAWNHWKKKNRNHFSKTEYEAFTSKKMDVYYEIYDFIIFIWLYKR